MIKLQNYTPEIYYKESRDFQFIGRLYDLVLNSIKTEVDLLYYLPLQFYGFSIWNKHIDTNNLGSAIDGIERLVKMADDLENNDFGSMKDFGKALKKVAEDGVSKFVKAFADAYSKVEKAAEELIDQAKTGVENKQKAFNKALTTLVTKGVNHIKTVDNYKKFKGAGQYLAEGFANGINCEDSIIKVETAATVMANAAKKAAEKAAEKESLEAVSHLQRTGLWRMV